MDPQEQKIVLEYKSSKQTLSYYYRPGSLGTILWLHAFCCSKEDFKAAFSNKTLDGFALTAFDFPGSPNSPYPLDMSYNFDDLVEFANLFIQHLNLKNVIAIGHSTGSLVSSLLAERYPKLVKAVVSVEGNMDLGDCWLTKKISGNTFIKFTQEIFPEYVKSLKGSSIEVYAEHLKRASLKACFDYSDSVLKYSETGLNTFLALTQPKLYIYCSENSSLPYIPALKQSCNVAEIPKSNHWPIYDNPDAFFQALTLFLRTL